MAQYKLTESNYVIKALVTQFSTNIRKQIRQTIYHYMVDPYNQYLMRRKRKQMTYITFFISSLRLQSSITSAYHQQQHAKKKTHTSPVVENSQIRENMDSKILICKTEKVRANS